MQTLKKIAILRDENDGLAHEIDELRQAFFRAGIDTKSFYESDSILNYAPDCVLVTSPQNAKLTQYPTYGLVNLPKDEYLAIPRFLRNILTYDGYLTSSPRLKEMLQDIMFGARKLDTTVIDIGYFSDATVFNKPSLVLKNRIAIFEPDFEKSEFKNAIHHLLNSVEGCEVVTFSTNVSSRFKGRFVSVASIDEFYQVIKNYDMAICLNGEDEKEQAINTNLLRLVASSMITITQGALLTQKYFSDNLYYISSKQNIPSLCKSINKQIELINNDRRLAIEKCKNAHDIFLQSFSFEQKIPLFFEFHQQNLIKKGYIPNPDPIIESKLPSVTYIMRTGGKHRPFLERALDCLVAQQYPNLHVIFVTHVQVPFLNEIINQYSSIKFKVIESIRSKRSEAIRDGIAAVETDLFGLFDDDDELFPNHVRMLVKTIQYHTNRDWRGEVGMVYSGSIHADDTYPVFERVEYQDHKLIHKKEKRSIEHFRFYSSLLMSQHQWFMPNGWLARSKLIDDEILNDPALDTCEDLYFELQLAQKSHFAFSVEVTAVHHFHHLGNSTIDDSHKHIPDTQRIALRNFMRVFPSDSIYDAANNLVGCDIHYDNNQILFKDKKMIDRRGYYYNQFYPFRQPFEAPVTLQRSFQLSTLFTPLLIPVKMIKALFKFIFMNSYKKEYYYNKFKDSVKRNGLVATMPVVYSLLTRNNHHIDHQNKQGAIPLFMSLMAPCRVIFKVVMYPMKLLTYFSK